MADTITVLNGLTHEQAFGEATYIDLAHISDSVVGTYTVLVPVSANQCRVIFNNDFSVSRDQVACRVRMTKVTSRTTPTKTETQVLEWTVVNIGVVLETGTIDVSDSYATTLHIDCCIIDQADHDGTEVIVEIASEASVDDAWTTIARFLGPLNSSGLIITQNIPSTEAAGQTVLSLTNPVANNFSNDGKFKFILNDTIANSEIIYQVSNSGDA